MKRSWIQGGCALLYGVSSALTLFACAPGDAALTGASPASAELASSPEAPTQAAPADDVKDLDACGPKAGPGFCTDDGSYIDGCLPSSPSSPISMVMCHCKLADPTCGQGFCQGGSYCTGAFCEAPVCYAPESIVSRVMCQGEELDPVTCELPKSDECRPEVRTLLAGVPDDFSPAGGAEQPSPSPALLNYIASVYPFPGSRDFDDTSIDRWFGHTFTGLAPSNGAFLCGATLHTRLHQSQSSLNNDGLALFFMDPSGVVSGPSFYPSLNSLGIFPGTSGDVTLDLGNLPNGVSLLQQMENGWLDFTVQDDSGVDFLELDLKYCCQDCEVQRAPLPGIVGYWSLDEPAGPISADQVQGNDGTWLGAPLPVPGIGCGALSFDGAQDHEITASPGAIDFGAGDFSISFYVTTSSPGLNVILDKRVEASGPVQGFAVYTYGAGWLGFQLGDGASYTSFPSSAFIADGLQHHVAITVDRDDPLGIKIYLDKNLVTVLNPMGQPGSISNLIPLTIGRRSDQPWWPGSFPGTLDEISLYRRMLLPQEINML